MNHSATQLTEELKAEAETLLSRHVIEWTLQVLKDVTLHYPAILDHFANPTEHRPAGIPEWLFSAAFEATDPDGLLCWPIFRGSLMSRAYSITSGSYINEPSLQLKTALVTLGFSHGHDGDPDDQASWIECASITGAGVAKALGESLYRRLVIQMDELEERTRTTFAA